MTEKLIKYLTKNNRRLKITTSNRKNKQRHVISIDNKEPKINVHYGDLAMKEYKGTKRGDNYCSRSLGIAKKYNILNDMTTANYWSRLDLWNCVGSKSKK